MMDLDVFRLQVKKGLILCTKAVTINPKFAEAHYNLGVALVTTGRLDEGVHHFTKSLETDPNLLEAQKALKAAMRLKSGQRSQPSY